MKKLINILGKGGHANVLKEIANASGYQIDSHIINDEDFITNNPATMDLINGIGSTTSTKKRKNLFLKYTSLNFSFPSLFHHSSVISKTANFGHGCQILAGAIIQPGCKIGDNVIINTGTIIDHDCKIEDHVHIAPGCTLSGNVFVGEGTHIGTGATIIQGIKIGKNCFIAAGAVVVQDLKDNKSVKGVPAQVYQN